MVRMVSMVIALLVGAYCGAFAQGGTLTARVVNQDGRPVVGAIVQLDDEVKGVTSFEGTVTITNIPAGDHRMRITAAGYQVWEPTVRIYSDRIALGNKVMRNASTDALVDVPVDITAAPATVSHTLMPAVNPTAVPREMQSTPLEPFAVDVNKATESGEPQPEIR